MKVGPTGRAFGIDMTPEMIDRATRAASDPKSPRNVEFHLATIDRLPLASGSVDVVISNCVINLATDKSAVFREIARVLQPGGRLVVSDIALKQALPDKLAKDVSAHVGCNAGANVGINVIYSGTVAAAIEAAFLGLPSIAVSLFLRNNIPTDFARAAIVARDVIQQIHAHGIRGGQCISVNLPALLPGDQPAGVKVVRQCTEPWIDTYDKRTTPRGRDYFWNSSVFTLGQTETDTDVAALRDGFVTVTPLQFDLTDHKLMTQWTDRPMHITQG